MSDAVEVNRGRSAFPDKIRLTVGDKDVWLSGQDAAALAAKITHEIQFLKETRR